METIPETDPAKGDPDAPAQAPAADAMAPADTAPDASLLARLEAGMDEFKADVQRYDAAVVDEVKSIEQAVVSEVEAAIEGVHAIVHSIERRSFGRASADEPMPVTTHTGN